MKNLEDLNVVELSETNLQEVNGGLVDGLLGGLLGDLPLVGDLLNTVTSLLDSVLGGLVGDLLG